LASEIPVPHGTSLALLGSPHLDRGEILGAIATELVSVLDEWTNDGGQAAIPAEVSQMCDTIGKRVLVERPNSTAISGLAASLSAEGGLLVEVRPGQIEKVLAGDVLLRAT
jgi:BirA family biotin operon repressor/biotin-[acetyl-CoA-carboxylase] ligase